MTLKTLFIIIVCWVLGMVMSCSDTPPSVIEPKKTPFFDLKGFFDTEIKTTLSSIKSVKKTVTVNGLSETHIVSIADWHEELASFINADINRPAWSDKYLFKKAALDNQTNRLEYYALADNLKTRHLLVTDSTATNSKRIDIFNAVNSIIAQSSQTMVYEKNKGYSIESQQNTPFSKPEKVIIKVLFKVE